MTVRCVFTIWGCYGSNSEASIKKKVVSVILSLFCTFGHHETPLRPPSNSLGLRKGSQRCLSSQATPSTAQKNSPAQKSRFELIWNRSVCDPPIKISLCRAVFGSSLPLLSFGWTYRTPTAVGTPTASPKQPDIPLRLLRFVLSAFWC